MMHLRDIFILCTCWMISVSVQSQVLTGIDTDWGCSGLTKAYTVTLTGAFNLIDDNNTVTVGGVACSISSNTTSQIVCLLPSATRTSINGPVEVTTGGGAPVTAFDSLSLNNPENIGAKLNDTSVWIATSLDQNTSEVWYQVGTYDDTSVVKQYFVLSSEGLASEVDLKPYLVSSVASTLSAGQSVVTSTGNVINSTGLLGFRLRQIHVVVDVVRSIADRTKPVVCIVHAGGTECTNPFVSSSPTPSRETVTLTLTVTVSDVGLMKLSMGRLDILGQPLTNTYAIAFANLRIYENCVADISGKTFSTATFPAPTISSLDPLTSCQGVSTSLTATGTALFSRGVTGISRLHVGGGVCNFTQGSADGTALTCSISASTNLSAPSGPGMQTVARGGITSEDVFGIVTPVLPGTSYEFDIPMPPNLVRANETSLWSSTPGGAVVYTEVDNSSSPMLYYVMLSPTQTMISQDIPIPAETSYRITARARAAYNPADGGVPVLCILHDATEVCSTPVPEGADSAFVSLTATALVTSQPSALSVRLKRSTSANARHMIFSDIFVQQPCSVVADAKVTTRINLPSTVTLSPPAVCPEVVGVNITLEGSTDWGILDADRVRTVTVGGQPCPILSVSGNLLTCALANASQLGIGQHAVSVSSYLRSSPSIAVFVVDFEQGDLIRTPSEWVYSVYQGSSLLGTMGNTTANPTPHLIWTEPLYSEPFFEASGSVTSFEHTLAFDRWDGIASLDMSVHAQKSDTDLAPLYVCASFSMQPSGWLPQRQCGFANSDSSVYPAIHFTIDLKELTSGRPQTITLSFGRNVTVLNGAIPSTHFRFYNPKLVDTGRCAGSTVGSSTGQLSSTLAFPLAADDVVPSVVCSVGYDDPIVTISTQINPFSQPYVDKNYMGFMDVTPAQLSQGASNPPTTGHDGTGDYPWVPRLSISYLTCVVTAISSLNETRANPNGNFTVFTCNILRPLIAIRAPVRVRAAGAASASETQFRFDDCAFREDDYALTAKDMADSLSGLAMGTAVITSALALITGAGANAMDKDEIGASSLGVSSVFRMVYYIQFVSMLGQTGGDIPESNRQYAQNYAWTNGQIFPPWEDCVPANATEKEVAKDTDPILRGAGECPIPEDELFLATLYWNLFFLFGCVISARVLLWIANFLWYRWRWFKDHVDVSHAGNFKWVMVAVIVRLSLLGVNGITVGATYQLFFQFTTGFFASMWALVALAVWDGGLLYLNVIVLHRIFAGNQMLSDEAKATTQFAFGSLYEGFKEDRRFTAIAYLAKRVSIAAMVGCLQSFPRFQMGVIMCVGVAYTGWMATVRPFALPLENKFHTFMEVTEVLQSFFFFLLLYWPTVWQLAATNMIIVSFTCLVFIGVCIYSLKAVRKSLSKIKTSIGPSKESLDETEFAISNDQLADMVQTSSSVGFGSRTDVRVENMLALKNSRQGSRAKLPGMGTISEDKAGYSKGKLRAERSRSTLPGTSFGKKKQKPSVPRSMSAEPSARRSATSHPKSRSLNGSSNGQSSAAAKSKAKAKKKKKKRKKTTSSKTPNDSTSNDPSNQV